jgi:hypothetical protein
VRLLSNGAGHDATQQSGHEYLAGIGTIRGELAGASAVGAGDSPERQIGRVHAPGCILSLELNGRSTTWVTPTFLFVGPAEQSK